MSWVEEKQQIVNELRLVSQDGFDLAIADLSWRNVKCPLFQVTKRLWEDFLDTRDPVVNDYVNHLTVDCINYIQSLHIEEEDEKFDLTQHIDSILYTIEKIQNLEPSSSEAKSYAKEAISLAMNGWELDKLPDSSQFSRTQNITNKKALIDVVKKVSTFQGKQEELISQVKKCLGLQ